MLLQPTSPQRTAQDIIDAFSILSQPACQCVIALYEPDNTPAKAYKLLDSGEITGLVDASAPYMRRQDLRVVSSLTERFMRFLWVIFRLNLHSQIRRFSLCDAGGKIARY